MKGYNQFLIRIINLAYDQGYADALSEPESQNDSKAGIIEEILTSDEYERYIPADESISNTSEDE